MAEDLEVLQPSAIEALNRSEIESQIEVAKRFPRSMAQFKDRAIGMATIDEETAASCIYRRPVGKEGGKMKYAEGMSIRMAEIVGAGYGNLRVYATLLSQTERQVVARGMAIDLEHNFASSSEVVELTVTSEGAPYSERMRAVVAKAALAKARRDATFQVVPRALAKPIEVAVRHLLLGEAKSLETRRGQVAAWMNSLGISEERVWNALGVSGLADIGIKELETLTGLRTAIKDNETTIDEAFPPEKPAPIAQPKAKPETMEEFKARQAEKATPKGKKDEKPGAGTTADTATARAHMEAHMEEPKGHEGADNVETHIAQQQTEPQTQGEALRTDAPPDGQSQPEEEPEEEKAGSEQTKFPKTPLRNRFGQIVKTGDVIVDTSTEFKEKLIAWIHEATTEDLLAGSTDPRGGKDASKCYLRMVFNDKEQMKQLTNEDKAAVLNEYDKERKQRP